MKNILIIGSGAREHAIGKAFSKSSHPLKLYCLATNHNPGLNDLCAGFSVGSITNTETVQSYSRQKSIDLAIIGPEAALAAGVSDVLWDINIPCIGPQKKLAQIETSKAFTRQLLKKYNILASPQFRVFSDLNGVPEFLNELGDHYVVKYDGLLGGKGVRVAGDHLHSHEDAIVYCSELVAENKSFVIEEKLIGQEFSLMSFCDGKNLKHMIPVQDHKRAYEDDQGPNTGGMGSYSDINGSLPFLEAEDIQVAHAINVATTSALNTEFNQGYIGILYGGFIVTAKGVKLIEYNARFGDPEAMNVLSLLESDFYDICQAMANGTLDQCAVKFNQQATVCKYAVPDGYPDSPVRGYAIDLSGIENPEELYYASVDIMDTQLIEAGSRTVAYVGIANSLEEAEQIAEKEISSVAGPLFHRQDIGTKTLIDKRIQQMKNLRGKL
jgi:phosphoribosylamine--glycine ligase